uniref:NOL1/NOP2/Sun domain family member 4 n=1 Tax=Globodera rostochiensis TaxID=31243 RepID=A0A914H4Z9_GLORO
MYEFLRILRFHSAQLEQRVSKSGSPRFKPKMAKVRPLRTPTMLALDNFDFYYGPIFGEKWPSIRLGLLTRKKFVAVLNRFSTKFEVNKEILKSLGTVNLMESMQISEETSNRLVKRKREMDRKAAQSHANDDDNSQSEEEAEDGLSDEQDRSEEDIASRLDIGMEMFQPSTKVIDHGREESKRWRRIRNRDKGALEMLTSKRVINDSNFKVTGLEGVDETLPMVEDVLVYPHNLELFAHPRMCIDGFPEPLKDRNNISSWWLLDGGSVLPVLALDLRDDDVVLDMCASPGGKSLLILQTGKFASLVCNDHSLFRLGQLRRALALHVPANSEVSSQVILKRKDASSVEAWTDTDIYDKVLLDASCTTDRRAVTVDDGNIFAATMTGERLDLPQLQTKMMVNALRSVRVGGSVVYSTCTLSPTQNEIVVENACALAGTHYGIQTVERSLKRMENRLANTGLFQFSADCRRGSLLLPNLLSNYGPTYVCKISRIL